MPGIRYDKTLPGCVTLVLVLIIYKQHITYHSTTGRVVMFCVVFIRVLVPGMGYY